RGLHRRLHRVLSRSRDPRPVRPRAARTVGWPPVKTFDELYAELAAQARERPAGAGPVAARDAGAHALGEEVGEEAAEVWMAAEHEGREQTALEISQLLYHLQVLMVATGLTLDDVYEHL